MNFNFNNKNKVVIAAVAALLIVGAFVGVSYSNSKAGSMSTVGYVHVSYLVNQYVLPQVEAPLKAELAKYQEELDAKIDKLEGTEAEKEAKAKQIYAEYQTLLDKKESELAAPHIENLKKAIDAVAKNQGLQVVVDNSAGVERPVVVWGGVDITQDVLNSLK